MGTVKVQTDNTSFTVQVEASKTLRDCIVPALIAALPVFINALKECILTPETPPTGDYAPGNRPRCN